jgi:hypothetical protein
MKKKLKDLEVGMTQCKSRFLFLPKTIGDEWRWLERAEWKEVLVETAKFLDIGVTVSVLEWIPVEWLN